MTWPREHGGVEGNKDSRREQNEAIYSELTTARESAPSLLALWQRLKGKKSGKTL